MASQQKTTLVLVSIHPCYQANMHVYMLIFQVINMQETTNQIINHIRIMIEEVECTEHELKVS